jgi:hypothetical protein
MIRVFNPAIAGGATITVTAAAYYSGWRPFSDSNKGEAAFAGVGVVMAASPAFQVSAFSRLDDDGNGVWNNWSRSFISRDDTHAPMQFGASPAAKPVVKPQAIPRASGW